MMYVSVGTTIMGEDFHIYEKALSRSGIPYIQKILGNSKGLEENTKVDYIYNLHNLFDLNCSNKSRKDIWRQIIHCILLQDTHGTA
ncbi:MAG: hypothetical protein M1431_04185 [Candidatus Thermoplasmatota archaeon]|nr:hypothetical protein [Candidatus Thermoplasmatota archaeon]